MTNRARCRDCGFRVRGQRHDQGAHHYQQRVSKGVRKQRERVKRAEDRQA